ncbi:hypothetical protein LSUE1_G005430 [Lachnellula suecica]|uniref:Aminoglycoside phosphotransferase domain-containing protein n=1 Tax=Lachnellula suecica TaxID=602035 RepID=A0A8T9C765_9HELO|nr:hypothetical protein LSUE1_G005430 [Lachnellula suecica]
MDDHFLFKTVITVPIRETIKEVDSNTWVIGCLIVHRSSGYCDTATWFDDSDDSSYTVTNAPTPPPLATSLLPSNPHIVQIHDIGDGSAVWAIGSKVFCKVHINFSQENTTPEDVTIPGQTLGKAWPSLSKERQQYYVKVVADICQSMAEWKGDEIGGVDGKNLPENYLTEPDDKPKRGPIDYSHKMLEKSCSVGLGMDCSSFVFYHADLGPGNIIVDDERVGIIDWEIAGYVPRGWIRTKFALSPGMDLPDESTDDIHEFRREVWKLLGAMGFESYHEAWGAWKP